MCTPPGIALLPQPETVHPYSVASHHPDPQSHAARPPSLTPPHTHLHPPIPTLTRHHN